MRSVKELGTYAVNTWCPGCGNFGILTAVKKALVELEQDHGLDLSKTVMVSGIGCHAKIVDYVRCNSFYSLHGRVPPPMTGIKLANPELTVIGHAGDGDAYGEGVAHLVFAAKRNLDATMIIHDNRVYGLTTGQFTPTSPGGFPGRSTPAGSPEDPINPIKLALTAGATFVARGYAAKVDQLKELIIRGVTHSGFSFIEVLQPCYTFFNTYDYYNKKVEEIGEEHDPTNMTMAMELAGKWNYDDSGSAIATGIFFQVSKPTYEERLLKGRRPAGSATGDVVGLVKEMI